MIKMLTQESVTSATYEGTGTATFIIWDTDKKILGLRIYRDGRKSFVFGYKDANLNTQLIHIGDPPKCTLKAAQVRALNLRQSEIALNTNHKLGVESNPSDFIRLANSLTRKPPFYVKDSLTDPTAAPLPDSFLRCSFCNAGRHEVKMLVASPGTAHICNSCIDDAYGQVHENDALVTPKPDQLTESKMINAKEKLASAQMFSDSLAEIVADYEALANENARLINLVHCPF